MYKSILVALLTIGTFASGASAGVIYELLETGTGNVRATLEFDPSTSNATSSGAWDAPAVPALSTLLAGGISGFKVDFGSGLEAATGGDIPAEYASIFQSYSGAELDFGYYWDAINSITFASGSIGHVTADNMVGSDTIFSMDRSFEVYGDWVLGSADNNTGGDTGGDGGDGVPEPGALASLALGLGALGVIRRRRRRK